MKNYLALLLLAASIILHSCGATQQMEEAAQAAKQKDELLAKNKVKNDSLAKLVDSLMVENQSLQNETNISKNAGLFMSGLVDSMQTVIDNYSDSILYYKNLSKKKSKTRIRYKRVYVYKTDTVYKTKFINNYAAISFVCPENMDYKRSYTAQAAISDVLKDKEIRDILAKNIMKERPDIPPEKLIDDDYIVKQARLYDMIELKLSPSNKSKFEIKSIDKKPRKKINSKIDAWTWEVIPKSRDAEQELILSVNLYDEKSNQIYATNKKYKIKVSRNSFAFFKSAKDFAYEHPIWTLNTLLLPVLGFLLGKYLRQDIF
ncbi:MAG: hypothetical protein N4A49_10755 [Marinifilaceae bacterium]|jgi:hypothetical protein|nr:hypothetical protein [Marinifilaceae bacterium]